MLNSESGTAETDIELSVYKLKPDMKTCDWDIVIYIRQLNSCNMAQAIIIASVLFNIQLNFVFAFWLQAHSKSRHVAWPVPIEFIWGSISQKKTSWSIDGWISAAFKLSISRWTVAFFPCSLFHCTSPASAAPWMLRGLSARQRNKSSVVSSRSNRTDSHCAPSLDAMRDSSRSEGTLWRMWSVSCRSSVKKTKKTTLHGI